MADQKKYGLKSDAYVRGKLRVSSSSGYPRQVQVGNYTFMTNNTFTLNPGYELPAQAHLSADVQAFYNWMYSEGLQGEVRRVEIHDGGGLGPGGMLRVEIARYPRPNEPQGQWIHEVKVWSIARAHRDEASMCWVVEMLHGRPPVVVRVPDELRPMRTPDFWFDKKTRSDKRVEDVPVAQRKNFLFPYTGSEIADAIDKQIDTRQVEIDTLTAVDTSVLDGIYHPEGSGTVKDDVERKVKEAQAKVERLKKEAAPYRKAADQTFDLDIEDVEHFGLADVDAEPVAAA